MHRIYPYNYSIRKSVQRVVSKVPTNENKDHVYNELCIITMKSMDSSIMNKVSNPKSDDMTSDVKKTELLGYQSSMLLHESCSTTSIEKSYHSNDIEDVRSIEDTDCHFEMDRRRVQDNTKRSQTKMK